MNARKPIAVLVAVTLLGMLFAGSFLGALHSPKPHEVPVAVVGPQAVAAKVGTTLDARMDGAFDIEHYADEKAARQALLDREVDGVFVPGQSGARLIVASSAGKIETTLITEVFQQVGTATGQQVQVQDIRALPESDSNGISAFFLAVSAIIPGVILAALMVFVVPQAGAGRRIGLALTGALLLGGGVAWVGDGLTGALVGSPWALWGLVSFLVFAVATVTGGLLRVVGPPAAALAVLLFVPIGAPASGGPLGAEFVPAWYAAVGEWLPLGAGAEAVRNTVYFDGNAIGRPLLVLTLWAVAGVALVLSPKVLQHRGHAAAEAAGGRAETEAAHPAGA
ncbi:hypothetical protein [Actinomadura geliboluensis]|uniref:hypothetical protein n=1 Tax=Actinomadura geliboluensis TaxID=882440 RepID=UPI003721A5F8